MWDQLKKGKRNKLKIGQKVRSRPSLVDWHSSHLSWSYGVPMTNDGSYLSNEKEIPEKDLDTVYAWAGAKLSKKMPTGVVKHYGAQDNDEGVDRNNVYVNFTFKTEIGHIEYGTYVNEKDLEPVKES